MLRIIKIKGNDLPVEFKTPAASRRLKLLVYKTGRVVLTRPKYVSLARAEKYLHSKLRWLEDTLSSFNIQLPLELEKNAKLEREHYLLHKEEARRIINKRTAEIAKFYGFKYKRISIRNQRTRWGSCSQAGNLNFNYRLIFLSDEELDYVIAHELCHLQEFNHSACFWKLVEEFCPNYKIIRHNLKKVPPLNIS